MEKILEQISTLVVKVLSQPDISALDKIFILVILLCAIPYIIYSINRLYSFSKQLPELLPKWHDDKKQKLKSNFPFNILRNKLIQSALEKMVYEGSADRAYVIQFHNGGENIRGIPFIKFSITNEWCPITVPKESHNYKDVPLGIFSGISFLAMKNKKLYFPDIEALRGEDSGSYAIFKSKKVESVYISGIFDLQDSLIGLVCMEMFEKTELDADELVVFEKTVGVISGLVLCKDGDDPTTCVVGDHNG